MLVRAVGTEDPVRALVRVRTRARVRVEIRVRVRVLVRTATVCSSLATCRLSRKFRISIALEGSDASRSCIPISTIYKALTSFEQTVYIVIMYKSYHFKSQPLTD